MLYHFKYCQHAFSLVGMVHLFFLIEAKHMHNSKKWVATRYEPKTFAY